MELINICLSHYTRVYTSFEQIYLRVSQMFVLIDLWISQYACAYSSVFAYESVAISACTRMFKCVCS